MSSTAELGKELRLNLGLRGPSAALVRSIVLASENKPKDVIFDALTLLDFAIQEIAEGREVGSIDPSTQTIRTVVTPLLQEARKNPDWLQLWHDSQSETQSKTQRDSQLTHGASGG